MKKALLILLAMVILLSIGCSHNISRIQREFDQTHTNPDQPFIREVVQKGETTTYYFFQDWGDTGFTGRGWYAWEYVCDKNGKVLKYDEYWIGNDQRFEKFKERVGIGR